MRKRIYWCVGVLVVLLLTTEAIRLFTPASQYVQVDSQFCALCGLQRHVKGEGPIDALTEVASEVTVEETPLYLWFRDHFEDSCSHQWRFNHHRRQSYASLFGLKWRCIGTAGSDVTPSLVHLDQEDRDDLDQRFTEDPEECRVYISVTLARRSGELESGQ